MQDASSGLLFWQVGNDKSLTNGFCLAVYVYRGKYFTDGL
jgi:hypothetical protein